MKETFDLLKKTTIYVCNTGRLIKINKIYTMLVINSELVTNSTSKIHSLEGNKLGNLNINLVQPSKY